MTTLGDRWRSLRRRAKDALPFVRRRQFRHLERIHAELIEALDGHAPPADTARVRKLAELPQRPAGEFCLFVTFADRGQLKPHVVLHVERLLAAGISVALLVNTALASIEVDPTLLGRLSGCWVRENTGFDFGAWAHALACFDTSACTRLYLVNDSIVGPLDAAAFETLLERVRGSAADVLGLTDSGAPRWHLQSYFLVLSAKALACAPFIGWLRCVRNWPTKTQVIEIYETRLTRVASDASLRCEALFPARARDAHGVDETSARWGELVERGFPYLKGRVVAQHHDDPRIAAWLRRAGLASDTP